MYWTADQEWSSSSGRAEAVHRLNDRKAGIDGRTILEIGVNIWNLVDSAQDRDYWRALLNEALHLWVQ